VVSSQVSQLPHGVRPPAQFTIVPFTLANSRVSSGVPSGRMRTSRVVVPPPPRVSYALLASPITVEFAGLSRISWLRTRRVVPPGPAIAAIPSHALGTTLPSDIILPASLSFTQWKSGGSASSGQSLGPRSP
jgi:hypothetical protein